MFLKIISDLGHVAFLTCEGKTGMVAAVRELLNITKRVSLRRPRLIAYQSLLLFNLLLVGYCL